MPPCSQTLNSNEVVSTLQEDWVDLFLGYLEHERQVSVHTLNAYAGDLSQFFSYLEGAHLTDPARWDARLWKGFTYSLRRQSLTESSIARKWERNTPSAKLG